MLVLVVLLLLSISIYFIDNDSENKIEDLKRIFVYPIEKLLVIILDRYDHIKKILKGKVK